MIETTPRIQLPLLASGQAQKEILHNEALWRADFMFQPIVDSVSENLPPLMPALGQAWIVGPQSGGDWLGKINQIALWTEGGWRYIMPFEGLCVRDKISDINYCFQNGLWGKHKINGTSYAVEGLTVVSEQQPAIIDPTGGVSPDTECRIAISQILTAMRAHGLIAT